MAIISQETADNIKAGIEASLTVLEELSDNVQFKFAGLTLAGIDIYYDISRDIDENGETIYKATITNLVTSAVQTITVSSIALMEGVVYASITAEITAAAPPVQLPATLGMFIAGTGLGYIKANAYYDAHLDQSTRAQVKSFFDNNLAEYFEGLPPTAGAIFDATIYSISETIDISMSIDNLLLDIRDGALEIGAWYDAIMGAVDSAIAQGGSIFGGSYNQQNMEKIARLSNGATYAVLIGDGGNNTYDLSGNDRHIIEAKGGQDTLDYSGLSVGEGIFIDINSYGDEGATLLQSSSEVRDYFSSIEHVIGTNYTDEIYGGNGANRLDGGGGDDIIHGEGGNDTLIGGSGSNIIDGGAGYDTAQYDSSFLGLFGADVKIREMATSPSAAVSGVDVITDVERINGSSAGDTFDIHLMPWQSTTQYSALRELHTGAGDDEVSVTGGDNRSVSAICSCSNATASSANPVY